MNHSKLFQPCVFLIIVGLGMYVFGLSLSFGVSAANPSWVLYLGILGLNVSFYSGAFIIFSSEFERKPKRLFKAGVVLVALDILLYLMAGWLVRGPSFANGHFLNAWGLFSLKNGLWAMGFNVLLIGIALSCLNGFEMMIVSVARALKTWISAR
jgi:hypothetical protein